MHNYQLYRTNVALGGQLKWNISVDNGPDGLFVSDFHIVPISDRVPFNRYAHDNLLNYSHLENIKSFYKKIESSFYLPYSNPILTSDQPYISDDSRRSNFIDLHDDTFDMGAKRARYSIYGKEIEVFCPIWLEDVIGETNGWKTLSFVFDVKSETGTVLCSKTLDMKPDASGNSFHDGFVKYLYQYIKSVELDDHLIHIDLDYNTAAIAGVDASAGLLKTVSINKLARDLTDRERLLMDADSMIIEQYANNKMIAKQLFNFNFLFNVTDFFPPTIMNMLEGNMITLDIRVKVDDEFLEIKDFYTNYDNIPSVCIHSNPDNVQVNILDSLLDNKNIGLVDKNKISQQICHWSIVGDDDYIFNVYPEFGGFYIDSKNEVHKLGQLYQDTPNIWLGVYSTDANTTGWLNTYHIKDLFDYKLDINSLSADAMSMVLSPSTNSWIKHVRYTYTNVDDMLMVSCSKNIWNTIHDEIYNNWRQEKYSEYFWAGDKNAEILARLITFRGHSVICFFYGENDMSSKNGISFGKTLGILKEQSGNLETWMENVLKWMESAVQPTLITLNKKLGYNFTQGPYGASELDHYDTSDCIKIIRVGGYIRPSFVNIERNLLYTKSKYTNSEYLNSKFPVYNRTGYPPKYPSIGYYPWTSHELSTDERNVNMVAMHDLPYEYHWFTSGKLYVLTPEFEFTFKYQGTGTPDFYAEICRALKERYDVSQDESYYIYKQYDWKADWEYEKPTDIHSYIYKVKMKLK